MPSRTVEPSWVLKQVLLPALRYSGYRWQEQVLVGIRFGTGPHVVDCVADDGRGRKLLVSLKGLESNLDEETIPFEAICLIDAVRSSNGRYAKAYLVMKNGDLKLTDFFLNGGLSNHLSYSQAIEILPIDVFITKVEGREL